MMKRGGMWASYATGLNPWRMKILKAKGFNTSPHRSSLVPKARNQMIIHLSAGLHERITDR